MRHRPIRRRRQSTTRAPAHALDDRILVASELLWNLDYHNQPAAKALGLTFRRQYCFTWMRWSSNLSTGPGWSFEQPVSVRYWLARVNVGKWPHSDCLSTFLVRPRDGRAHD